MDTGGKGRSLRGRCHADLDGVDCLAPGTERRAQLVQVVHGNWTDDNERSSFRVKIQTFEEKFDTRVVREYGATGTPMNVECCVCLERESGQPWGAWPCGHVVRSFIRSDPPDGDPVGRPGLAPSIRLGMHSHAHSRTHTLRSNPQMHLPCIYRVFGKEYDEDDPEQRRRIGQVSNNSVKCPLCNQKTRLRNVVRLYLQAGGEMDGECEGEDDVDCVDLDEVIIVEDGAGLDGASCGKQVRAALENNKKRITEMNVMLTSTRRRYQVEAKERMRLEQEKADLEARVNGLEEESKRRLDAMRSERDDALRERKMYERKAANLLVEVERVKQELEGERAFSSRQAVALDDGLTGDRLRRKLRDCADAKDWFHDTLETRNRKIMTLMNGMEHLEKEAVLLKKKVDTLERENRLLSMDIQARQKRGGDGAAVLGEIENVPAPTRKQGGGPRGVAGLHRAEGGASLSSKPPSSFVGSVNSPHELSEKLVARAEEDMVVLLDDDDVVGDFAALAAAAASTRRKPVAASFAMAGPSRDTINTAPGPSFIKGSAMAKASTGLDNPGTYIKRHPDGRGGWTQNGRPASSSGRARKIQRNAEISDFFAKI